MFKRSVIFYKLIYSAMLISLCISPYCYSEEVDYTSTQQCIKASMFCDSLTVRGEFYRVIEAVYQQDFKDELQKKAKMNDIQDKDPKHFLDLTKIENYDFGIDTNKKENKYHVSVGPKIRANGPVFFRINKLRIGYENIENFEKIQGEVTAHLMLDL